MITQIIVLAALGLDTLAVAVSFALAGVPGSHRRQVGLILALYGVIMPVIGLVAGESLSDGGAELATYVAGLSLIGAGAHGVMELRTVAQDEALIVETVLAEDVVDERALGRGTPSIHSARRLHLTAMVGSVDKLAVGLALGAQDVRPAGLLVALGIQSFLLGVFGMAMGHRLGARLGHKAELASKLILIGIGVAIVVSQLLDVSLKG